MSLIDDFTNKNIRNMLAISVFILKFKENLVNLITYVNCDVFAPDFTKATLKVTSIQKDARITYKLVTRFVIDLWSYGAHTDVVYLALPLGFCSDYGTAFIEVLATDNLVTSIEKQNVDTGK